MVKNIIFDTGGVLLLIKKKEMDNAAKLSLVLGIPKKQSQIIYKQYKEQLTTGRISVEDFLCKISALVNINIPLEVLLKRWKKTFLPNKNQINLELFELINNFKKRYNTYIFLIL